MATKPFGTILTPSINTFSSYDDSKEIMSPILRIELRKYFYPKLTNGKQVINAEDVDSLVTTMGSIQDFEAIEEPGERTATATASRAGPAGLQVTVRIKKPKKLFRDNKRKVLGRSSLWASPITFGIDPLWIRLSFSNRRIGS